MIRSVITIFGNVFTIIIVCGLTLIYYLQSNYYQCGKIISHFSLTYTYCNTSNDCTLWNPVITCGLIVLFNMIVLHQLNKLNKFELEPVNKSNIAINYNITPQESQLQSALLNAHDRDDINSDSRTRTSQENGAIIIDDKLQHSTADVRCTVKEIGKFCVWFVVFLILNTFTVLYTIINYTPNNNIFNVTQKSWFIQVLKYVLVFILFVNNSQIIPHVVDSSLKLVQPNSRLKIRTFGVTILRCVGTIIIPFIVSYYIINDCGKLWIRFWNPCAEDKNSFNYDITFTI